jgi:heptosyltransferase-2
MFDRRNLHVSTDTMTTTPGGLSFKQAEAAARGCMVKFSPGRRLMIRLAEMLMFPFIRGIDCLRSLRAGTSKAIRRILVVECGNLGDIVALLPFLHNLRVHYPDVQIALLANPKVFPLIQDQQLVDELIPAFFPWLAHFSQWKRYNPFSSVWIELARTLIHVRRQKFDMVLCARGDIRDNFVVWLTRIRRRIGYGFLGGGSLLTEVPLPDLNRPHRSDWWLRLLEHLGKPILIRQPHLRLSDADRKSAQEYLAERDIVDGEFLIGIHPGARIPTRQWGATNFRLVGERLGAEFSTKILWFQDPNERGFGDAPTAFVPVFLPLRQFMAVLARCNLLICNDSGPMHIATALGVPVVAVFGPTEPAWFGPLGEQNRIVIHQPFWCRPCSDRCIFDQPYCLRSISIERVLQEARGSVAGVGPEPVTVEQNADIMQEKTK